MPKNKKDKIPDVELDSKKLLILKKKNLKFKNIV
jgi:hypothetical protein